MLRKKRFSVNCVDIKNDVFIIFASCVYFFSHSVVLDANLIMYDLLTVFIYFRLLSFFRTKVISCNILFILFVM